MKRLALLFAACALVASCDRPADPPTSIRVYKEPATFPPETYTLFGVVRDLAGRPLPGAVAAVSGTRGQLTNLAGAFALSGVRGHTTVRVGKDGYEIYVNDLVIAADTALDVRLGTVDYSDTLVMGRTIRSFVPATAEPCDPVRWDAKSPCRKFFYTAPANGRLDVSIGWFGAQELDATITTTDGIYVGTSTGAAGLIAASAYLSGGVKYEVRVNAYYDFQTFTLRAEFRP